jgi:hypothetical protein
MTSTSAGLGIGLDTTTSRDTSFASSRPRIAPKFHTIQSNLVVVNGAMHSDARAAVESVLRPLADFRAVKEVRRRRPRHQLAEQIDLEEVLAELARSAPS